MPTKDKTYKDLQLLLLTHDCILKSKIWTIVTSPVNGKFGFTYVYIPRGDVEFVEFIPGRHFMHGGRISAHDSNDYEFKYPVQNSSHIFPILFDYIKNHINAILT